MRFVSFLRSAWIGIVQTCLRVFPFRCRTGLIPIGEPDPSSPVLLTCNFRLTVERVKAALKGLDVFLLVANSRGVNVWCAATGGLFTNHDVVSALKTSGIQDRVNHRRIILPQLAATGIEASAIRDKTGWHVVWGPVDVVDIPAFLESGLDKTHRMRTVEFGWRARSEVAVSWAFPMSTLALLGLPWWKQSLFPLIGLIWAVAFLIFLSFPLYRSWLRNGPASVVARQGGVAVFFALVSTAALTVFWRLAGALSWEMVGRWGLGCLVISLIISVELLGSTPVYKSGTHEDRRLRIRLDEDRCTGVGTCEQVCPTDVFEVDYRNEIATLPRDEYCVQCGACIVQCPVDALCFVSPDGKVVTPDTVRTFKLNLLGKRLVKTGSQPPRPS